MYISFIHVVLCSILKHMFEEFGKSPFLLFGTEGEKTFYEILMRNWEGGE